MKRGIIALFVALLIVLGAIIWHLLPALYFLVMMAKEPEVWGCDEGLVEGSRLPNGRDDAVAEYLKLCTGFGTIADYSIVLELGGVNKPTTLVEHSDPQPNYPKFRWLDNDTLVIDLGKVSWLKSPLHKVGSVNISYVYSIGEP